MVTKYQRLVDIGIKLSRATQRANDPEFKKLWQRKISTTIEQIRSLKNDDQAN
jgi:hypothetical protein